MAGPAQDFERHTHDFYRVIGPPSLTGTVVASLGGEGCVPRRADLQPDPHPSDASGGGPCVDQDARRISERESAGISSEKAPSGNLAHGEFAWHQQGSSFDL